MRYFFYQEIGKWVKQCSHCYEITEGTADEAESFAIFKTMFSPSGDASGAADNLQSRCWICNASKRRSLGMTRKAIEEMMSQQNGKYDICSIDISIKRNASEPANVDHDEKTGKVRALLCGNCNRGIGSFFHKPALLRNAAKYCEEHSEKAPLRIISDAS